jgi:hypothetical protein
VVRLGNVCSEVALEKDRAGGRGLAEDIELSVADQPVIRICDDELASSPSCSKPSWKPALLRSVRRDHGSPSLAISMH